ncbi:hypothetical protein K7432_006725 [Basidiobolus ranarum]|uniref:Uncharacterized protein n=1 Tax=Basidiobolus ranarum TaxID=34480 RepID=A0ABR2WUI2_9FUNG
MMIYTQRPCTSGEENQSTNEETIPNKSDGVIWIEEGSQNETISTPKVRKLPSKQHNSSSVISLVDDNDDVEFLKEIVHSTENRLNRQNAFSEHAYSDNDVTLTPPPKHHIEEDSNGGTNWQVDVEFDKIKRSLQASADSEILVPIPKYDLEPELQAIAFKCEKKYKEAKSKQNGSKVEIMVKPMSNPRVSYETDNKAFNMIRDIPLKFSMFSVTRCSTTYLPY